MLATLPANLAVGFVAPASAFVNLNPEVLAAVGHDQHTITICLSRGEHNAYRRAGVTPCLPLLGAPWQVSLQRT